MALFATIEASFWSVAKISPGSIEVPALISSSISERPSSASSVLEVLPVVVTFGKVNFHFSVHEFFSIGARLEQGGKQKLNLSKKIQKNNLLPIDGFFGFINTLKFDESEADLFFVLDGNIDDGSEFLKGPSEVVLLDGWVKV